MPPKKIHHYIFDPRKPDRVPALGSNFLMHRFTSAKECYWDDICLRQIPKRAGERPTPGIDPDYHTGWGMHLKEGLSSERLCLVALFGVGTSITFGTIWAACKGSLQDGFAVAGYIIAVEALGVAILQLLFATRAI
jgi:hypothetical protein